MVKKSGKKPLHCVFGHEVTRAFHTLHGKIICGDCVDDLLALIRVGREKKERACKVCGDTERMKDRPYDDHCGRRECVPF